jgi:hypothetical protein
MNLIKKKINKYLKENIHLENELKTNLLLLEYDFNS